MSAIYTSASEPAARNAGHSATVTFAFIERVRWRARRLVLWMRYLWSQGLMGTQQGLAIGHEEVDRLLLGPERLAAGELRFYETDETALALRPAIDAADEATRHDRNWQAVIQSFGLTEIEGDLLSLAVAAEIDTGLRRVFAYLHDDLSATSATWWLASRLFGWTTYSLPGPNSNLLRWLLVRPNNADVNQSSPITGWVADQAIVTMAKSGTQPENYFDPLLGVAVSLLEAWRAEPTYDLYPAVLARMCEFAKAMLSPSGSPIEIEIIGPDGAGKRTLGLQFASRLGRNLLVVDVNRLLAGQPPEAAKERVVKVLRMARATNAVPYWKEVGAAENNAWRIPDLGRDVVLIGRQVAVAGDGSYKKSFVLKHVVRLEPLDTNRRLSFWKTLTHAAPPNAVLDRALTAGEMTLLAEASSGGEPLMEEACRSLTEPPNELVEALPCPYSWDDLVLSTDLRMHLQEFEQQARLRWPVYEEWGFQRLCPLGKGISALFAGPSGTGKTMAAQVIARSLGLELYRIDLAGVVNKYIGETEKRLKQVFDRAERNGVLLFFDEADALFGQRMQVKDAHDRFANIEIDYLLQRMERYDGIAVLATNRKSDLDNAFLRRIRFLIDFLLPGPEERLVLWQKSLLPESPAGEPLLDSLNWEFLAQKLTLTGAEIKNAALGAAFLARSQQSRIRMGHVIAASRRELAKRNVLLRTTYPEGA